MFQRIFFSYSRIDNANFALKLARDLRNANTNIWIDQLDIRAGEIWDTAVENALKASDCILFIVSKKSVISKNVLDEVYYGLDIHKPIIPVLTGECEIPFRLKRLQYINFIGNYEQGFKHLLESLKEEQVHSINNNKPQSNKKRIAVILLAIIGAILFFAGTYYFFNKNSNTDTKQLAQNNNTAKSNIDSLANTKAIFEEDDSTRLLLSKYYFDHKKFSKGADILYTFITKNNTCANNDTCYFETAMDYYNSKNFPFALACFAKAAEKNNSKAMCMIGNMYYAGEWVVYSLNDAYIWYNKAAAYKNSVALLMLGVFEMQGKINARNFTKAKDYFNQVVLNNDNNDAVKIAKEKLKQLQAY